MSAVSHGSDGGQDFELNLASIIDCFTVLIAFMLVSASFLSIGIIDAGVAAAGATASAGTPPDVNVTVELRPDHSIVLKVSGKTQSTSTLKAAGDGKTAEWNLAALDSRLSELKGRWPSLSAATLSAGNTVEYKDIIQVMETTRKRLPAVMLGGF